MTENVTSPISISCHGENRKYSLPENYGIIRRKKKLKQTAKAMHEEIVDYKNYLVKAAPGFVCSSAIVKNSDFLSDAERMKYIAAVFLYEAELATETACTFAINNNIKWLSHYLLDARHSYESYRIVLSVLSRDWAGAEEVKEKLCLNASKKVLVMIPRSD